MAINVWLEHSASIVTIFTGQWKMESIYRVSQDLRSLFRDLIPQLILNQKRHIHMAPIRSGSGILELGVFKVLATHDRRFSGHMSQKMHPSRWRTLRTICLSVERLICNYTFKNMAQ